MWLLILTTLLNAVADTQGLFHDLRVEAGGLSVGPFEVLFLMLIVIAPILGVKYRSRFWPDLKPHPAMIAILVLFAIGFAAGLVQAMAGAAPMANIVVAARDYLAFPICLLSGYLLLPTSESGRTLGGLFAWAGIITGTLLFMRFGENAEHAGVLDNTTFLRTTGYVSSYAGVGAIIMFYAAGTGLKLRFIPKAFAPFGAAYCFVAQCAPLARIDWIAVVAGFCACMVLIPRERRVQMIVRSVVLVPLLLAGIWVGITVASSLTQRDFMEKITNTLKTLVPSDDPTKAKAWDTRLPGIALELDLWMSSPLLGRGFGAQETFATRATGENNASSNHNGWASVLAKTGVFGLASTTMIPICMLVLGYRLVHSRLDDGTLIVGVLTFCAGVMLWMYVLGTMIWIMRNAMLYTVLLGAAFKCRDIQRKLATMGVVDAAAGIGPIEHEEEPPFEVSDPKWIF